MYGPTAVCIAAGVRIRPSYSDSWGRRKVARGQGEVGLGQGSGQIARDQTHIGLLDQFLYLCHNNNQLHGPRTDIHRPCKTPPRAPLQGRGHGRAGRGRYSRQLRGVQFS
jgi:hypothetical protein